MCFKPAITACLLTALLCGCAARRGAQVAAPASAAPAATPADRALAALSLDEIEPKPVLPTTSPSTQPAPPLDAIDLYAKARSSLLENQRYTGIRLLEPNGQWASYDVLDVWYQKAEYGEIWIPYMHVRQTPAEKDYGAVLRPELEVYPVE